jgi:hypothetical protein
MKKTLALIALCLGFVMIGYGLYRLTGCDLFWIWPVVFVAMLAVIYLIGLIIWLFEYIGKP